VLAIAAAKIFHTRPLASDIDPVAVAAARDNARLNRVGPLVSLAHAPGTRDPRILRGAPYDLIFANILLGPLTRLAAPIARLVAPGGRVVLSGLLPSHANAARSIYAAQGLHLERRRDLEGWTTLILRR
jgi:ribosomal protein L11 methyltransferase